VLDDLYGKLGVRRGASQAELERRYKELEYAYSINPTDAELRRLDEIRRAYHLLADPVHRASYNIASTRTGVGYLLRRHQFSLCALLAVATIVAVLCSVFSFLGSRGSVAATNVDLLGHGQYDAIKHVEHLCGYVVYVDHGVRLSGNMFWCRCRPPHENGAWPPVNIPRSVLQKEVRNGPFIRAIAIGSLVSHFDDADLRYLWNLP
jgi:hypothetical protein